MCIPVLLSLYHLSTLRERTPYFTEYAKGLITHYRFKFQLCLIFCEINYFSVVTNV